MRIAAAILSLVLSAPAHAAEPFLGGVVKDSDVTLLFDYLRDAMSAAFHGREVAQPPDALVRRAEVIAEEVKRHGEIAARAAVDAIERDVRESMRRPERLSGSI